jgi:nicotinamidase/pyrazinamidase
MTAAITVGDQDALLVIDVQNDFLPGGALAVPNGGEVVPLINRIAKLFKSVVVTQDWHPEGHASFASSQPGAKPFETMQAPYGAQTLWPDHCIQGSEGAALSDGLKIDHAMLILRKGTNPEVDSYSAFVEADGKTATGLAPLLKARGIARVFLCGLATDFCVGYSALDARKAGFEAFLIEDACRAIDFDGSLDLALADMNSAGVVRTESRELLV